MSIQIHLDVLMARKKVSSNELANAIGISKQNLSVLKTGRAKAIRFSNLEAICEFLECQPGELLAYEPEEYAHVGVYVS